MDSFDWTVLILFLMFLLVEPIGGMLMMLVFIIIEVFDIEV